ncbi:MAG: hypothetical protein ABIG56_05860 [Candidatus Omnitrophota bacterium]
MDKFLKLVVLACCIVVIIAFFLPWVNVESQQAGSITKVLTGKRQGSIASISGIQVPVMANSDESRLLISIAKIFFPKVDNVDKKSFAVCLIPLLALIIIALNLTIGSNKMVQLACAVLGVLIFAVPLFKIMTTDMDKLILQINIGIGLWLILLSYLAIGGSSIIRLLLKPKK